MKKNGWEIFQVVFAGFGGVIVTLLFQYLWPTQLPQTITYNYNGQQIYVTEDSFLNMIDRIDRLEKEIQQLKENGNPNTPSSDIIAEVWLRNGENINKCPQIILPQKSQIADSTYYEMTWEPFKDATTYKILIWKDANYGATNSNMITIDEIEVNGLSYMIDFSTLEYGYVYGFNVVVDNHYSAPLLVELH